MVWTNFSPTFSTLFDTRWPVFVRADRRDEPASRSAAIVGLGGLTTPALKSLHPKLDLDIFVYWVVFLRDKLEHGR